MSFFSGIVDECDRVRLGGYPGAFRELLGLRVEEFWPLSEGELVGLTSGGSADLWADHVVPEGAEVLAAYTDGPLSGSPAITRHAFCLGTATYLGTRPDERAMRELVRDTLRLAAVPPVLPGLPDEVEAVRRGQHVFLLNHGDRPVSAAGVELAPRDVVVLADGWARRDGGLGLHN